VGAAGLAAFAVLAVGVTIPFGSTVTVTVVRPAAEDGFGDPTGGPTQIDLAGCVMWVNEGTEDTDHADTVIAPATLVTPAGADLRATDRVITADEGTWEVVGEPTIRRSPFTSAALVEAHLRKVTG
jgi:hypothetical protein